LQDNNYKSSKELIHYLVRAAGYNANFLLNVGPMPNGKIQQECIDTLKIIGEWLDKYGETIYGSRGGPVAPRDWGVTTQKGNKVFAHILNWEDDFFLLPKMERKITSILLFHNKEKISFTEDKYCIVLELPKETKNMVDVVLEIDLAGK
jgi:alpha-L-fucosidase